MLILKATLIRKVEPYLDFNSSVNCTALTFMDGKIVAGRVCGRCEDSEEVYLKSDRASYRVKESDIVGIIRSALSDYDTLELMQSLS